MSRSYRKTPVCGWSCAESEKRDKQLANRALRCRVRAALATGRTIPVQREVSQVYAFSKDGKQRFDPEEHPREMRK